MAEAGDFTAARRFMVDGQIRTNKVTDEALLAAMSDLPRERFAPTQLRGRAYVDDDLPLGGGRFMMEPMVLARLLQALQIQAGDAVLVVGANSGYAAALAAMLGGSVTALESDASLASAARQALAAIDTPRPVEIVTGPLPEGHVARGPYRAILIEGAVEQIPARLGDQLAEGGRLATVQQQGAVGRATLFTKIGGVLSPRVLFDANVVRLPGFEAARGFRF
ncbi:MAG: protein-L-isoaspartate O-methyltransferase [Rhodospirillaceae bacterium]|nr:protein-L-isoaspartate O-methyltransferase [Rhodospirillaceae bacterium]